MTGDSGRVSAAEWSGEGGDRALGLHVAEGGLDQGEEQGERLIGGEAGQCEEALGVVLERNQVVAGQCGRRVVEGARSSGSRKGSAPSSAGQGEAEFFGGTPLIRRRRGYGHRGAGESLAAAQGVAEGLQGVEDQRGGPGLGAGTQHIHRGGSAGVGYHGRSRQAAAEFFSYFGQRLVGNGKEVDLRRRGRRYRRFATKPVCRARPGRERRRPGSGR